MKSSPFFLKAANSERGMVYYGAHIQRKQNIVATLREVKRMGGSALQIFVSNPRSGRISLAMEEKYFTEASDVQLVLKEYDMQLWVHSAYTLNLARSFSASAYFNQAVLQELRIATKLGASGVILHMGKFAPVGDMETGLRNMRENIIYILSNMPKNSARLLLETPSGMGSELAPAIDEIIQFYTSIPFRLRKDRLGICLDTAHVWAAGYKPSEALQILLNHPKIMAKNLPVVQINNHTASIGSHTDRHACVNQGTIHRTELESVVKSCALRGITILMETKYACHATEIKWIRSILSPMDRV